jgi:hypothetical protein
MPHRDHNRIVERFPGVLTAILDVRPLEGRWGRWNPDGRVIEISEKLLDQTRWLPAKGIMGHETAHQIVHDLYPLLAQNEPPHGPCFIRVCRRMELDPYYWRASMDFDGPGSQPPCPLGPDPEDEELKPVLEKVKKLLALASSENTNESALALSAAERLLARYSIDMDRVERAPEDEPYRRMRIPIHGRAGLRHSLILNIMTEYFGMDAVYTWNYDPSTGEDAKEVELLGRPMNLAMGEYVWAFLNERCETLWEAYRPMARVHGEKGLGAKNAFVNSLLRAFSDKMAEGRRNEPIKDRSGQSPASKALASRGTVAERDAGLAAYKKSIYPRLSSTRHTSYASSQSPNAAGAGAKAGRELSIRPPVGHGAGSDGPAGYIG